jgi:hypothetical protein
MERILKKILLQKLKEHDKVDYKHLSIDKHSYTTGYANGFVQGFYAMNKWIIVILIVLAISLIFNFISLYLMLNLGFLKIKNYLSDGI